MRSFKRDPATETSLFLAIFSTIRIMFYSFEKYTGFFPESGKKQNSNFITFNMENFNLNYLF